MPAIATGLRALGLLPLLALAACANLPSPSVYGPGEVMQKMVERHGVIVAIREATLQGSPTGAGVVAGGGLGGLAGSQLGGGRGHIAGGVFGAALGQAAGGVVEQQLARRTGLQISYREDGSDEVYVTVQPIDPKHPLAVGDRIRIVEGASGIHISRE